MELTETLAKQLTTRRKQLGLTQEQLAAELGVSFQAVSKWENHVCCPDLALLPRLAALFGTTIDSLLGIGKEPTTCESTKQAMQWPDDKTLRVVLYQGHTLLIHRTPEIADLVYRFEGPVMNVESQISITCGDVAGNVTAGGGVGCGQVGGSVTARGGIHCDMVDGDVLAGGSIHCDSIGGDATAGCNIQCDTIKGNAQAQTISCENILGSVSKG